MDNQLSVPIEAVLKNVTDQRNNALDENAGLRAVLDQVVAERDQLAAEVERLRGQDSVEPV